jgi:large repetitive protein
VTVSDGVNSCTGTVAAGQCTLTLFNAGNRTLTAQYVGDANFNGSTSSGVAHTVNKADTTTTIQSHNPDPSVTGQSVAVAYTVTVNSPGGGTPTGTVLVSDGTNSCTGTVAAGTCNIVFTSAGSKSITATYQGDANYNASPASAGASHTVNKANTTAAITSDSPDPSVVGQPVVINFTVAVTSPGAGTPTGNVMVSDGTDSCTATVAAGTCSITFNTAGPRTLTATYQGDANFNASAASPGQPHTVNKAATTTMITSDTPAPSVVGQPITVNYTVTVNASGAGTPSGNVQVSDGINSCTGTVAAGSCSLALFTAGSRPLTASYQGDSNFLTSTSASAPHQVSKANTTTAITSDNPDPSIPGQSVVVNFGVSVVAPGAGTPTGNVVVTVNDASGDTCTGTVAAGTCNLTLTTAGNKTLTATYVGDSNYNGSAGTDSHEVTPPTKFAINDASVVRPTSGNVSMLFTVTLTQPAQSMVTVAYQTANDAVGANPGVAGTDYIADSGTVTFNTGEQFKVIAITIPSNPSASGDKTFLVNLSSPSQGTILDGQAKGTIKATRPQSTALITEVRTSGPAGADDDFVEVYNNTNSAINVASTDGSAGWAVVKMGASCSDTPVIVGTIPNGTMIPSKGHYLFVGASYSLGGYAPGDSTLSVNIDSDANLALFTVADLAKLSADNKLDGVGFGTNTGGICDLLRNGNTLPVALGSTAEHSYVRKDNGSVFDTGDNQDDFNLVAVSQAATIGSGTTPVLGAPGPQNLQSPVTRNGFLTPGLISPGVSANLAPNRVRVQGPYNYTDPITSQSITFPSGTIAVRRSYRNNTGQNMTSLRFRIVIITAGGPIPAGTADVRAISSLPEIVNVNGSNITVQGTTLQQLPNQPEGGGLNASMGCCRLTGGTVTGERTVSLAQPLAPGQTISLQWLLGVKQTGNFQFYVNIEGLP